MRILILISFLDIHTRKSNEIQPIIMRYRIHLFFSNLFYAPKLAKKRSETVLKGKLNCNKYKHFLTTPIEKILEYERLFF